MSKPPIQVAVGILQQPDGHLLLTSRPADKPWPFWWELPGGKIEPKETPLAAVRRELYEELGVIIDPDHSQAWVTTTYHYPKGPVTLNFFVISRWSGTPTGLEGQALAWVHPQRLGSIGPILPATLPILRWLRLPSYYLLSSAYHTEADWLPLLAQRLQQQPMMVQFREPQWQQQAAQDPQAAKALYQCLQATLEYCRAQQVPCLINSIHPQKWWPLADGVQLRSRDAQALQGTAALDGGLYGLHAYFKLPAQHLFGVSTHNRAELDLAARLQADFAVLGHVLPTPSHPHEPALGWPRFATLSQSVTLPVYAIGGQNKQSLLTARHHGAHGIAGLRQLLTP